MQEKPLPHWRLILSVFLPFAAGYYLTFLFRTINASISPALVSDFGLGAARDWTARVCVFPDLCRGPDPNRRAAGSLWAKAGPERVAGDRGRWRGTVRQC